MLTHEKIVSREYRGDPYLSVMAADLIAFPSLEVIVLNFTVPVCDG